MSQEPPPDDKDSKALAPTAKSEAEEEQVESFREQAPPNIIREALIGIIREGTGPRF